jgi:hypothetical protein
VMASLDGRPLPPRRIRIGPGRPYGGGPVSSQALLAPGWIAPPPGGGLRLWLHRGYALDRRTRPNPETERRLRALGYLQ